MILKTLDSVFSQTYLRYEVIVVDDGSTDGTAVILESHIRAGRIRFIKNDRNYERAHSRNTGMQHATGDFVTFLDSDDLMYPANLESAACFVRANPEIKFFHNLYHLVDENDRVILTFRFPSLDDPRRAITNGNFLSCHGVFIHREIYQRYRFDTNAVLTASEDWDFWLRVLADYPLGRIDKINSAVVHHSGRSVKHLDFEELRERMSYIVAKVRGEPHLHAVYRNHLTRLEIGSLIYMSSIANASRQHREALKCLSRAYAKDFRIATSVNFMKALFIAVFRVDKGF